jgi:hypothetical protein
MSHRTQALALATVAAALAAPAAHADWTAPRTLTRPPLVDGFQIDAAANTDNVQVFAWIHTSRHIRNHRFLRSVRTRTRRADGSLTPVRTISRKDVYADTPRVGIDHRGRRTIVWTEIRPGSGRPPYVVAAFARRGKLFGRPVTLGRARDPRGIPTAPALAVNASGRAVVGWTQRLRVFAVRSHLCGPRGTSRCFGQRHRLATGGARPVGIPAVAIGQRGAAYVAFATDKPALRLAASGRNGGFLPTRRLSGVNLRASKPTVAAGVDGAIVAWHQADPERTDENEDLGYGPVVAATTDETGTVVTPAETVDPSSASTFPVVQTTSHGDAILMWNHLSGGGLQVFVSTRPADNFGPTAPRRAGFEPPTLIATSAVFSRLAVNGRGDAAIAYSSPTGITAVVRSARGQFGSPIDLAGAGLSAFIAGSLKFTAAWTTGQQVSYSDLTP